MGGVALHFIADSILPESSGTLRTKRTYSERSIFTVPSSIYAGTLRVA